MKLIRSAFGDRLVTATVTVEEDLAEEDEVERMLVVDIVFRGGRLSFHKAYGTLVSKWANRIPPKHHPLIQFRFHIVHA